MRMISRRIFIAMASIAMGFSGGLFSAPLPARAQTQINFYYPVAVGGPMTKIVDAMVADFEKANPGIKVKAIYSGSYQDTITKMLTALKGGDAAQVAVAAFDRHVHADRRGRHRSVRRSGEGRGGQELALELLPRLHGKQPDRRQDLGHPVPALDRRALLEQGCLQGGGARPREGARHWDEMREFATKLTKRDASGNVSQWGIEIPSGGFPYWLFQGLATQNGAILMNEEGTKVSFDKPAVVEALQYWVDLTSKDKVAPSGLVEWGTTPKDFFEGKTAMMWTTTGNLTNVRDNAKFPFGVAMLPAKLRRGTPTGGGNFYLFKKSSPEQKRAAVKFVQFMTSPEQAARWSIATGYIGVSPAAFETKALADYVASFPPAAVARDQLQYAVAEFSTHDNQRVTKVFDDNLQAALTGTKSPAQALKDAQAEAERLLRSYQ